MLSILTVNIGAAAPARALRIAEWLQARDDDVVIFTETSNGTGTAWLLDAYRHAGWHVVHTPSVDGDRGAALATRIPPDRDELALKPASLPHRLAATTLATSPPVAVVGVYVPSRDRSTTNVDKKRDFIASLLDAVAELPVEARGGLLLGGDYNVIDRNHKPLHSGFFAFELDMTQRLAELGLDDAFTRHKPGVQEYSWVGRTGDGYRYDYFHLGATLADRIAESGYLHHTRNERLTDHAAVALRLDVDVPERLDVLPVVVPALF
ncbi:MAG: endonuclease/exonuclease/phosphatase family protein [Stackebrandtia sp.]